MVKTERFEKIQITTAEELRSWLVKHHKSEESFWLVTFKKEKVEKYVSRTEILDELICFGWIDGIRRKLDAQRTMQLICRRKTQHWSKTYKDIAAKMIASGKMHESGNQSIAASKKKGLWNFLDDVDKLIIPPDLSKKLLEYKGASDFFETINPSSKRFVLRWIKLAKTEKTRKSRIVKIAQLASKGQKLKGS